MTGVTALVTCSQTEVAAYYKGDDEQRSEDERGRDHRDLPWE